MTNYRLSDLNDKTPKTEQDKLRQSLTGISGVSAVQLNPSKSEISISFKKPAPDASVVEAAVKKAGFHIEGRR